MTLQEKAELLNMYRFMRSAAAVAWHFKINESSIRTIASRKGNLWSHCSKCRNLAFFAKCLFISYWKCSFYVGAELLKKGIPVNSNMIQEKVKSLNENLKQKEGEGSKAGEFNASKGGFDNFRERFGFKNVKITGEKQHLLTKRQYTGSPDVIRKIFGEKGYLPKQVFNSGERALFWGKKKCCKGHLLVRNRKGVRGFKIWILEEFKS